MKLIVTTVESVEAWGTTLSLVRVKGVDATVVANRHIDGAFRWAVDQPVVYVPENAILPEDVLKARGYWEDGAKKGMLGGSKGNRVKGRTFGRTETDPGVESKGLLFSLVAGPGALHCLMRGDQSAFVGMGDDVSLFLGATEFTG